jgi:subtilase family serine protease
MKTLGRKLQVGCALALACLLSASAAVGQNPDQATNQVTETADNAKRTTLKGNVHPLARVEFSQGPAPDDLSMSRMLLLLKRSDAQETTLRALLDSHQEKSSATYHKWLTPQEFGSQFGPSDSDIQAISSWLTAQGFHEVRVGAGRSVIEFSGSVQQVAAAFATQIQNYTVQGRTYVANSSDPQIPSAFASVVGGIVSLHNFPKKSHARFRGDVRRSPAQNKLEPLFTFPDPNGGNFYGVGPGDFATIYNSKTLIGGGNNGTGVTIAVVGETEIDPTDVSDFRTMFGLPVNFSASNIIVNGMDPGITSKDEESEADLDVQWSGAVAPGATVKLVVSASTPASAGIDLSALYIVDHNLADVISLSYGSCESELGSAGNAFYSSLWEQAAAQGMTVSVSAGDGGSAGCDSFDANPPVPASHGIAVSGLAGTPFNVSVGGTDFNQGNVWTTYWNNTNDSATGTSAKSYIPEIPWNQSCAQLGLTGCGASAPQGSVNIVAGGGGPSSIYSKPKWQMGVAGMPSDNHRDQPDVALFAGPGFRGSGYLFCQKDLTAVPSCNLSSPEYTFHVIGGTSASAPAFAGVMALVNQYAAAHGGTLRQGNANVTLYALANKSGASCTSSVSEGGNCIFNDVSAGDAFLASQYGKSVGTNSVPCTGGTLNCSATVASTTGVLVDPSHTSTEAWTAGTGYDMASGLGSMNIGSLVSNWTNVSTIGTYTTLALSPTTGITHGQNENVSVTVNVKANTGIGVPTGDVSLLATLSDGTTLGLDHFTLTNGSISGLKTQNLPGGTYNVSAHYSGDGINAPSDSALVQVTVGKESSQTFIAVPTFDPSGNQTNANASSIVYGSNYIIRMYVANDSGVASPSGVPIPACQTVNEVTCPTGTVLLTGNGAAVDGGTFALNNQGYTRDLAPTLTGGTYSLVANYPGDNSYTSSTSPTHSFTITPAPTKIQMDSYPSSVTQGQSFQLEANVTSQLTGIVPYPGGTVTFFDGNTRLPGTVQISQGGNGQIYADIYNISFSTPGPHTITAQYSGDANYAGSNSAPVTVTLLIATAMTQIETATTISYGQSVTVTAIMTSNSKGPAITGSISFGGSFPNFTNVSSTAGIDKNGNQMLNATATTTPPGTESIYAYYQGDANYAASSTTGDLITVNIPDFALGPSAGVSIVPVAGQSGSAQITITPLSQTPSNVSLSVYGIIPTAIAGYTLALAPQQVSLNGTADTATLSLTPTGTAAPQSNIRRNTRHAGFIVLPRNKWWSLGGLSGLAALLLLGLPGHQRRYRFALGLGAAGLLCFAIGCGGGGTGSGPGGSIGNSGGSGGSGSGGGNISPTPTSITLTTSNAKVDQNTSFVLTAQVTGQHPLTGTVSFYDNGSGVLGPLSLTNGQAQTTAQFGGIFGVGLHQLTAVYSGDSENLTSTSAPVSQAITGTYNIQIQGWTGADGHFLSATVGVQ